MNAAEPGLKYSAVIENLQNGMPVAMFSSPLWYSPINKWSAFTLSK